MLAASPEQMFETQWPHLFSLLKTSAQQTLPAGLSDYISGPGAAVGGAHLHSLESNAGELVSILGHTEVAHTYRRDLSTFTSEQQFAEFACELSMCTALSRVAEANSVKLRPAIPGQQKRPDIRAVFSGYEVFAEVKRYGDKGPGPKGRSIALSNEHGPTAKPRMMDLADKLRPAPAQLPGGGVNILFVFHPGYGENQMYIQQALFGDKAFFGNSASATIGGDALFAEKA
jgi:hypothetical protein